MEVYSTLIATHEKLYQYWYTLKTLENIIHISNPELIKDSINKYLQIPHIATICVSNENNYLSFDIKEISSILRDRNNIIIEFCFLDGSKYTAIEILPNYVIYQNGN